MLGTANLGKSSWLARVQPPVGMGENPTIVLLNEQGVNCLFYFFPWTRASLGFVQNSGL